MIKNASLQLNAVSIAIGTRSLFAPITARVAGGECLTLMGPSGSGKSTLLAFVAGTLDTDFTAQGSVRIGDTDVTALAPERRRIGILFQDDLLFPHLSVGANLAYALPASVRPAALRRERIDQALSDAGLAGDRKSTRLNSSHRNTSRMPSSA